MLDRLRQNVAVKELLQSAGRPLMRKTASVPNFSHVSTIHPTTMESYVLLHKQMTKTTGNLVIALFLRRCKNHSFSLIYNRRVDTIMINIITILLSSSTKAIHS